MAADGLDGFSERVAVEAKRDDVADAERGTIACVLCDVGGVGAAFARADAIIREGDFADPRRAAMWAAMRAIVDRFDIIDRASVAEQLSATREHAALKHLADFASLDVSPMATEQHARRVREHAYRRAYEVAVAEALRAVRGEGTPLDAVSAARTALGKAPEDVDSGGNDSLADGMFTFMWQVRRDVDLAKVGSLVAARWGLASLDGGMSDFGWRDGAIGGMYPGELYVLGGVPASGKTSLAMRAALATAKGVNGKPGRHVMYFSLEMSRVSLCRRLVGQHAGISNARIKRAILSADDVETLQLAADEFAQLPIDVIESARTVEAIRARVLAAKTRINVGLVVVDFLQLAQTERGQDEGYREDEDRVYALKHLANAAGVPVLAISSMTKEAQRAAAGGKVDSTGTKGAGAEYAADVIAFLVRTDPNDASGSPLVRFEMTKSRDGVPSSPVLKFNMARGTFEDTNDDRP